MALRRLEVTQDTPLHPAYVVWELTLACDQPCTHCGSRAGDARADELSTDAALEVVAQLAAAGAREVVLIGGEAYLHPGFLEIVAALARAGIRPTMTTGGRGVTPTLAASMTAAGLLHRVGQHRRARADARSDARLPRAASRRRRRRSRHLRAAGVRHGVEHQHQPAQRRRPRGRSTTTSRALGHLVVAGADHRAARPRGRPARLLLQPWDLLDVVPRVAALKVKARGAGILLMPGNNLGYFGPEEAHAPLAGARAASDHWQGCQAGRFVMGIESDGAVKGCPSLQTSPLRRRQHPASRRSRDIWDHAPELAFARRRTVDDLWGFCRTCTFAATCMGGCTFTAHAVFGRPGNNPYCHYRARTLARAGRRERLVPKTAAPGAPFDNGTFDLVEEPLDAPDPRPPSPQALVKIRRPRSTVPS